MHKKTVSFWSMINSNLEKYRNPHYVPYSGLIFPETSVRRLWVWERLFFRDCTSLPPPQDHCPAPALERQAEAAAAREAQGVAAAKAATGGATIPATETKHDASSPQKKAKLGKNKKKKKKKK